MGRTLITIAIAMIAFATGEVAQAQDTRATFTRIVKFMKSRGVHSVRLEFRKQADRETQKLVEAALTKKLKAAGIAVVNDEKATCFFTVKVRMAVNSDGSVIRTRLKLCDRMESELAGFSPFLERAQLARLANITPPAP